MKRLFFLLSVLVLSFPLPAVVNINTVQQPLMFTASNVVDSPTGGDFDYVTTPDAVQTPGQAVGFTINSNRNNSNFDATVTPATATLTSGGNTMQIHTFRLGLSGPGVATFTGTTNGSGNYTNVIYIGATLTVPNGAPPGTYTGTFTLQVRVQNGWNADTRTQNYNVSVTVAESFVSNKYRNLSFGLVVSPVIPLNITVSPDNVPNTYGGLSAWFDANGEDGRVFNVDIQNSSILINSGGNNMTVDNFTLGNDSSGPFSLPHSFTFQPEPGGTMNLYIGADCSVGIDQPSGTYTGNNTLILTY